MTRSDAITALVGAWEQRDSEFALMSERPASLAELAQCLRTLGVTDRELDRVGLR